MVKRKIMKKKVFEVSFIAGKGRNRRFIRRQELAISELGAKQKIGRVFSVTEFRDIKIIKDKRSLGRQLRRFDRT